MERLREDLGTTIFGSIVSLSVAAGCSVMLVCCCRLLQVAESNGCLLLLGTVASFDILRTISHQGRQRLS